MTSRRSLARVAVLTGILFMSSPVATVHSGPSQPAGASGPAARLDFMRPPEVRLRKLHLVRPDLIPYPIEYEVVC